MSRCVRRAFQDAGVDGADQHAQVHGGGVLPRREAGEGDGQDDPAGGDERRRQRAQKQVRYDIVTGWTEGGHAGCGIEVSHSGHAGCGIEVSHSGHAACRIEVSHSGHAGCGIEVSHSGHAACRIEVSHSGHAACRIEVSHSGHAACRIEVSHSGHAACRIEVSHSGHAGCGIEVSHSGHAGCGIEVSHSGHAGCGIEVSRSATRVRQINATTALFTDENILGIIQRNYTRRVITRLSGRSVLQVGLNTS